MSRLESTCLGKKCIFWDEEDGRVICPFYIQTMWDEKGKNSPTILEDCAPKRNTMMLMDYSNRAIGIQQDYEEQRNMYSNVLRGVGEIVKSMQERNKMLQEKLGIEYKEDQKIDFTED